MFFIVETRHALSLGNLRMQAELTVFVILFNTCYYALNRFYDKIPSTRNFTFYS